MVFDTITEYLEYITQEFLEEINGMNSYCDLKNVSFKNGLLPNYNNRAQALLYCLRYHFGYAFEYEYIYNNHILGNIMNDQINVLSIGCGNGIDLWSLNHAIEESFPRIKQINYIGVDPIDWGEKFTGTQGDNIQYYYCPITQAESSLRFLRDIDVLFLPKSISELKRFDLECIANIVAPKTNWICLAASFRTEENNFLDDMNKFDDLIDFFEGYGLTIVSGKKNIAYNCEDKAIISIYSDYVYPDDTLDIILNLYNECASRSDDNYDCNCRCQTTLSRNPILRATQVRYNCVIMARNN